MGDQKGETRQTYSEFLLTRESKLLERLIKLEERVSKLEEAERAVSVDFSWVTPYTLTSDYSQSNIMKALDNV